MPARKARALAQAAPQTKPQDDDPIPENIDDFRNELARRISRLISNAEHRWSTCGERACKRARNCRAPRGICINPKPETKPEKPEQVARTLAQFQRMVRERVAQMDAEREDK